MKNKRKKFLAALCPSLAAAFFLSLTPAQAATRTVYFNQSGTNKTTNGIAAPGATSTCKLTISNPSQQTQTWSSSMNVSSINMWSSATTSVTGTHGSFSTTSGSTGSCTGGASPACSGSLVAGGNVQITFNFDVFPPRSATFNGAQTQKLRCSGSITATDPGQPGFLIANGVLVTFIESAAMSTDGTTSGSTAAITFGGIAVYSQVPIAVNRGKPF